MDTQLLDKATIEALTAALVGQMQTSLDKRDADLCVKIEKSLNEKLEAQRLEEERRLAKFNVPGVGKAETEKFQFIKLVQGKISGDWSKAGYELELCREAAKLQGKAMTAGTDSAGGFLVPHQVLENELIPLLRDEAIAIKLGVRTYPGLTGSPVQIGKITAGTSAYWVGETPAAITTSQPSLGQLNMTPHTLAARTMLSNRLIMLSGGAAEALIREQITLDMALALDLAVFSGTGVDNQPRGILQTSGIGTVTSFGSATASTAYNKLLEMILTLATAKALRGTPKWAVHPTVIGKFQQMLDPADATQPKSRRMFDSAPISDKLLGYNYEMSTQLPTNDILFGNFADVGIGMWSGMTFKVSDVTGTTMETLQTMILAAMDVDIVVRRPESFCSTTGMTNAP